MKKKPIEELLKDYAAAKNEYVRTKCKAIIDNVPYEDMEMICYKIDKKINSIRQDIISHLPKALKEIYGIEVNVITYVSHHITSFAFIEIPNSGKTSVATLEGCSLEEFFGKKAHCDKEIEQYRVVYIFRPAGIGELTLDEV